MFLCSGARSTGAVAGIFRYNFGGKAQVGKKLTNLLPPPPSAATWTLQDKLRRLCCPRVHDALCVVSERLEDVFKCTGWKYSLTPGNVIRAPRIMCALESGPVLTEFNVFCFPWMRKKRKTVDVLCVSENIFARNTELCTTHAFMDKVRPNALSAPAKGEPDIQIQATRSPQGGDEEPERGKDQSKTMQLKKVFKEYGAVGVSFHVGISLISLGIFYIAVSSGIDMATVLCKMGFSESVVQSKMATGTSTFVLAYAVHKLFAPVRISITLVSVPFIVRYFRKTGLFKPPPTNL